jgi:hypothetical protein
MKTRLVRPDFFSDDRLAKCGPFGLHLYLGLMCLTDRDGRLEDRPIKIKAQLFPFFDVNVDEILDFLASAKLIVRYEVASAKLIEVVDFSKHQQVYQKEKSEGYPAPSEATPKPSLSLAQATPKLLYNTNIDISNNTSTTEPTSKSMCAREPQVIRESRTTENKAVKVREPERAEFVHISDQNYSKLIAKYGESKTKEACEILSAWISSKVGQLAWFEKKYSGAFEILNNKTCWVWEKVKSTEPPKSKRQLMLNGWMEKAFADIEAEKASSLTAEDLNYYETLLITE